MQIAQAVAGPVVADPHHPGRVFHQAQAAGVVAGSACRRSAAAIAAARCPDKAARQVGTSSTANAAAPNQIRSVHVRVQRDTNGWYWNPGTGFYSLDGSDAGLAELALHDLRAAPTEALAARLKRVAGRPRLLAAELNRLLSTPPPR